MNILPGILLCILIGSAGWKLGFILPLGAVTISIILGMLFANVLGIPSKAKTGVSFSEKKILAFAIALLGFSLDYKVLLSLGVLPLILILCGVPLTIFTALGWGRLFKVDKDLALLVGTGNGICGSSAIAVAQGVINAEEEHVGVSIAVINLLGTLGILLLPLLVSRVPHFTEQIQGMIIGNTLQAVGQVTAAGFSLGDSPGQIAAVVKMGRVLLISPVVLLYGFLRRNNTESGDLKRLNLPGIPPFILLFLLFSLINTVGILPAEATAIIKKTGEFLLIPAMAGIGMKISFKGLAGEGKRALIIGILTWTCQITFTLVLVQIFLTLRFIPPGSS